MRFFFKFVLGQVSTSSITLHDLFPKTVKINLRLLQLNKETTKHKSKHNARRLNSKNKQNDQNKRYNFRHLGIETI